MPPVPSQSPPLSDLLEVIVHRDSTHHWVEARLPAANRASAALLVATHIARMRCGGAPQYFDAWLDRRSGGPAHPADLLECLVALVASESIGMPPDGAIDEHIEGFVAEHIWHLLALEDALTFGVPVRVDEPDWSVTDSGGDGLAIYRSNGTLVFRLWESKAHTGEGTVRDVVNGACRQVNSNALRYLARFSKVGQGLGDPELQQFYGRLLAPGGRGHRELQDGGAQAGGDRVVQRHAPCLEEGRVVAVGGPVGERQAERLGVSLGEGLSPGRSRAESGGPAGEIRRDPPRCRQRPEPTRHHQHAARRPPHHRPGTRLRRAAPSGRRFTGNQQP